MEVKDQGYRFHTLHNRQGNSSVVTGHFERYQTQAAIRPNTRFALDFYGKGSTIEITVTTEPRRLTPQQRVARQRERLRQGNAAGAAPVVASESQPANMLSIAHRADTPPTPDAIRAAAVARLVATTATPTPAAPSVVARTVGPEFHSPFDHDWLDGWGLDPLPFPPIGPGGGGGGGGGGGVNHSAVRIELFVYGQTTAIETWELPEAFTTRFRSVKYQPQGLPSSDAPVRQTTWFRVVATPLGPDPVMIYLGANTQIATVPVRVTSLATKLTNHLFRVGLEALVPSVVAEYGTVRAWISEELTDLIGTEPIIKSIDISPGQSFAKLRSLKITTISGAELAERALQNYRERAAKIPAQFQGQTLDQRVAFFFKGQLERLAEVKTDDVCLRMEAGLTKALVSVWGLDLASLDGDFGELFLTFNRHMNRLHAFAFFDIDFTLVGALAKPFIDLFTSIPTNANKLIEESIRDNQGAMLKYLKGFLERAVGQSNVVYECWFQDNAWKIANTADPVLPKPGFRPHFPGDGGPLENGGILEMLSLADALGDFEPPALDGVVSRGAPASGLTPAPAPAPNPADPLNGAARDFPPGFLLTPGEQLARLDRHQSIVVVMMENRSYDHLLGDLMHLRPDPDLPYDGAPFGGTTNGAVHGLIDGVKQARARDIALGTAIPVDPRHSFNATKFQIGDGTEEGRETGDMLGFARDLYRKSDSPQQAMSVYGPELETYYRLAQEFHVCDRWFAAHPGPTFPNRFATIMGRIPELENFHLDDPRIGYLKDRTIFDALTGARIEWRLFESDLSLIRMFDKYRIDSTNVVPIDDAEMGLQATLRRPGPLPRVMFIEPNFTDIPPFKTADDDHPPADLQNGQRFIKNICNLLWDTGRFDEVLLVITYDEHGGFYDHVPPPGTARGEQRSFAKLHPGGPNYLGVRVPAFVVSPYVTPGSKSRVVFDHTSILKTILVHNRDKFSNDMIQSFGPRVAEMPDLSAVLELPNARQSPPPFFRRTPTDGRPGLDHVLDLSTIADLAASPLTPAGGTPAVPGFTPREVVVTEITVPPGKNFEADDFHGALYKLMRPRQL